MTTFVLSLVLLVAVVGPLATWAIRAERRKARLLNSERKGQQA